MRCANLLRFSVLTLFAALFDAVPSWSQGVQLSASTASAIAADLESGDIGRIAQALQALPYPHEDSLYTKKIPRNVALALIKASEQQTNLVFNPPDGYNYEEIPHEFASGLSDYVVALKMPEAIPALLKATQFGNPAAYALADFGPDIVYDIIKYLNNPERTYQEINGGFFALLRAIETHRPLTPSIRSAAKEMTMRYLERAEEFYTGPDGSAIALLSTISVARVLGDSDLKKMVIDILPLEKEQNIRFNGMGTRWAQYTLDRWDIKAAPRDQLDLNE